MVREQTFDKLYSLKLHGLAATLEEQLKNPEMDVLGFEERLALLVDAQYLWRENRATAGNPSTPAATATAAEYGLGGD